MKRSAVAGAVLFAFAGAAAAQATTAQASLTDFSYQLIDLDPNDGIAPSITFTDVLQGAVILTSPYYGAEQLENAQWSTSGEPVWAFHAIGDGHASAAFSTSAFHSSAGVANAGYHVALAGWEADYTLSANTKLVFTGHASASLNLGAPVPWQAAVASVNVEGYYRRVSTLDLDNGGETSFDEWFEVELANNSDAARHSRFSVTVQSVAGVISPVPEPATYLMLGTGLLLTAAAARRRRVTRAN